MTSKRAYDRTQAERMRPLLEEIARELDERYAATRQLERRLRLARRSGESEDRQANLTAELAEHRRNLRHALLEIEALGCAADPGLPSIVRVPGEDGSLESGYRFGARYVERDDDADVPSAMESAPSDRVA